MSEKYGRLPESPLSHACDVFRVKEKNMNLGQRSALAAIQVGLILLLIAFILLVSDANKSRGFETENTAEVK